MTLEWMEIIHPEDKKRLDAMGEELLREGLLSIDYRAKHIKQLYYLNN